MIGLPKKSTFWKKNDPIFASLIQIRAEKAWCFQGLSPALLIVINILN